MNYRPITLLNTDYKLLSKILAVRLADIAPSIIHKSQAGFVPGRKIHNHTQLARMMMYWAEENEENGAIVALDQEKAYDKIAHDYLWRVLATIGIPRTFIDLVKSLYRNAKTSVMINGILSKPYQIYRGVRQGDPLSCLLFDLAIEPLSAMIRNSAIKGFSIPRCNETLKAVLFADDTTVYLSCRDDFKTLQEVLDTWCSAAKARFNMSKTEIIPLGSPAFRKEMAETYERTGGWENYPRGVHVAQDGEAVRILGAFFGNGLNRVDVWSLVLTKIVAMRKPLMEVMARWRNGHATIHGKKHVIQMIVGGMTQYLTTVQRMPDSVVMRLNKIMRGYLWEERHNSPVGMDHIQLPIGMGGLGIADLKSRNEAIDVMWLKSYMDMSANRPTWAFLADDLLATFVTKDCQPRDISLRVNPFLQKWKPRARGLPEELCGMMSVAKKYGLRLEGLALSKAIVRSMPMWNHIYADRVKLGQLSKPSKVLNCLQTVHKAMTVGDFADLAIVLRNETHQRKRACICQGCRRLKMTTTCADPHKCCTRAKEMVSMLPDKWNPEARRPEDYERQVMSNLRDEGLSEGVVAFDRRITTEGDLGQALRIFTDDEPVCNEGVEMELDEDGARLTLATDGSCLHNGEGNARAGVGVFCETDLERNVSLRLPENLEQSNQTAEIAATLVATRAAGSRTRVVQETDSQTTMASLTEWRRRQEDTGYILQKNAGLIRATIASLRERKAHTLFKWVKGHNGHARNEQADRLAGEGARKTAGDTIRTDIPGRYRITGAKLQAMTQKLAYRAIRSRKDMLVKPRPRATANLDRITSGIKDAFNIQLSEEAVWSSFRKRHVSRQISQFMWMSVHDGYMIGSHWLRATMPAELQARAICAACGECETMSHIIFECTAIGQSEVWGLLKTTWAHTEEKWHEPCWGTAFGAACAIFTTSDGARKAELESLWCILGTEALHLIWKLRCERVIQREGKALTVTEVTNRYYAALESRLNLDRRTATLAGGKRALKPRDVERIWSPIVENLEELPPRWVVNGGVLVGIKRG